MKKAILAIAAAATIAVGTVTIPSTADARPRGGGGVGAGIAAGIIGGAILGGVIANSYPRYAPEPGYVVYEGYGARYPVSCPGGYWARRPIAFDAYGNPIRWSRARFICP